MGSDTIFALSSGRPPAAIAIIRISGALAHHAGQRLAGSLPEPRTAALRQLREPATGDLLDEALVLRFDGPATATGEDLVELHCHGGRAVVDAILGALSTLDGLRQAQPGEFTRRALENGRIDLTEAEGLADLLEAETQSQRRAALLMAEGGLKRQIEAWQHKLIQLSARAEAAIDYVDEDDVGADGGVGPEAGALANELTQWLLRPTAEPLREGILVVIAGSPNAGKSSLLNALCGHERAIVSDQPGTTRDHIEVSLSVAGMPIRLTDTAGIRDTDEQVERVGVQRARSLIDAADVLIWMGDPAETPEHPDCILVHGKADIRGHAPESALPVSAQTGAGVAELLQAIAGKASALLPAEGQIALSRRQAACVQAARDELGRASESADAAIIAHCLRGARIAFDHLTGKAGVEDMLDALFGRFCLGK